MRLERDNDKINETAETEEDILSNEEDALTSNNADDIGSYDTSADDYNLYDDDFMGDVANPPMKQHADILKELTNFDPFIKDMIQNWLGRVFNEKTKEYEDNPAVEPIMNLKGALWCAGYLKTYTRGNNIITDISSDDYKSIMSDHIEAIWLNLGTRDDLGIEEDGDLLRVGNELEHAAALILMGAGDGKYNKFLGTTITRHETIRPDMELARSVSGGGRDRGIGAFIRKALTGKRMC